MKKIRALCLLLCVAALLLPMRLSVSAAQEDASVVNGCHSIDAARPLGKSEKMLETSKAVILFERNSKTLLYGYNLDQRIFPSSMVKIMTALVALEEGNPEDVVTVTKRALSYVAIGSVSAELKAGEEISLRDLLYCVMVQSANDASTVVAEHIAGSQEAFTDIMNRRAQELGCRDTHFSNAHGLHDEQTYTTVRDICRILDAALENEDFRTLFQNKSHTVPATNKHEQRVLHTTNYMISKEVNGRYFDKRVTGGKTGATKQAGRCLAVTAEGNGMEMIGIVMGAEAVYEEDGLSLKTFGSFEEMSVLLDFAFDGYEYRQVFFSSQALNQYPVSGGSNYVAASPEKSVSTILPLDMESNRLDWVFSDVKGTLTAPLPKGQVLADVQIWYGDLCVAQTNLISMHAVDVWEAPVEPTAEPEDSEDRDGIKIAAVVGIFFAAAVAVVAVLLLIRAIKKASRKAARRRRRKSQRRER